mmetsp:Transcript_48415/g.113356  ORF Transcript_48415/g.113356 Transcript_48415/m.113356 type:complete len:276 (+) Transcript_48415:235-1062(+)
MGLFSFSSSNSSCGSDFFGSFFLPMYLALMRARSGSICKSALSSCFSSLTSLAVPAFAFLSSFFLGFASFSASAASAASASSASSSAEAPFLLGSLYLLTSLWMASFSLSPFFLLTRAGLMSFGLLGPPSSSSSSSKLANMFLEVEILTCPLLSSRLIAEEATDLAKEGYFLSSFTEAGSLFFTTPQAGAVVSSSFSFSSSRTSLPATSTFIVALTTSSSCQPSSSSDFFLMSFFSSAGFSFVALLRFVPLIFFFLSFLKKSFSDGASAMRDVPA